MADIELVIKIDEKLYKEYTSVQLCRGNGKGIVSNLLTAIKKGKPLPEHHGRLIDADKVLDDIVKQNPAFVSETEKHKRYARLVYYWKVKNAPTIVEGSESEE